MIEAEHVSNVLISPRKDHMATKTKKPAAPRIVNDVLPSTCAICGSQDRSEYENTRRRDGDGICHQTGRTFVAVIWRDCRCLNCGQRRVDRTPVFVKNSDSESD